MRRLLAMLVAVVGVLLLGPAYAWASHPPAPVPSMGPGETVVQDGFVCRDDLDTLGKRLGEHCEPARWLLIGPHATELVAVPDPLPVSVTNPATSAVPVQVTNHQQTVQAMPAESVEDLDRLAQYAPAAGGVLAFLAAAAVALAVRR